MLSSHLVSPLWLPVEMWHGVVGMGTAAPLPWTDGWMDGWEGGWMDGWMEMSYMIFPFFLAVHHRR